MTIWKNISNLHESRVIRNGYITGAPVTTSCFFFHPPDWRYGASPDGIGQTFLLEVKNRALNSLVPLDNVTGPHILPSNFQVACTGGNITFQESYLPEQIIANVFFFKRDNLVIDVCKAMLDHILEKKIVTYWPHEEQNLLKNLVSRYLEKCQHLKVWGHSDHGLMQCQKLSNKLFFTKSNT